MARGPSQPEMYYRCLRSLFVLSTVHNFSQVERERERDESRLERQQLAANSSQRAVVVGCRASLICNQGEGVSFFLLQFVAYHQLPFPRLQVRLLVS